MCIISIAEAAKVPKQGPDPSAGCCVQQKEESVPAEDLTNLFKSTDLAYNLGQATMDGDTITVYKWTCCCPEEKVQPDQEDDGEKDGVLLLAWEGNA